MHVRKHGNLKTYYSSTELMMVTARATWRLLGAALSSQADVIHIGKPHPMNSLAGLGAQWLRGRTVFLDSDDYEAGVGHFRSVWQKSIVTTFENRMPFRVQHITTNTYFTRDRLIALGVDPQAISYISNGIDRQRFASPDPGELAGLRGALGLAGKQVVAFVGSLSRPGHPVDLLFQAFARVLAKAPDSRLLLVGGGDDYPRLVDLAQQMGIAASVVFCGRIAPERVALYYYLAQVSIDPVLDDGAARGRSPLKLFESWACGVPFVTCDVGDRGRLLAAEDSGGLPAGLLADASDPELTGERDTTCPGRR